MSKRNGKIFNLLAAASEASRIFLGKIGSCTSEFAVSIQTFSSKYTEQEIKDYKLKFQGRSPKFKDFSRTNSFWRTFQGKPKIQGLFKDCGNPVIRGSVLDWRRPSADKNWKWPILGEWSGQNGLSKFGNQAQMADHFYGIPATASPCSCFRTC